MNAFKDDLFNYRYKVVNLTNHATHARCVLNLNNLRNLAKPQCKERTLLIHRSVDTALNLLNLNCCHNIEPPVD